MNKYFRSIIIKGFIYFLYCEIKHFLRVLKYFFYFLKNINVIEYILHKEKSHKVLKNNLQKKTLEKNSEFWKNFYNKQNDEKEILITNMVNIKRYTIYECIVGLIISKIYNKKPVGLINQYDFQTEIFMKSFGINKFYYIPEGNFFSRIKYFFKSVNMISKIKKTDELTKLTYEKVDIGKIVYNHFIRYNGIGSIDNITPKFYVFLSKALLVHDFAKAFFETKKFKEVVQSESQFIPPTLIFQNALNNNCNIFSRIGTSNKISVRIYNTSNEFYKNRYRFSKKLFNLVYEKFKNKVIENADEIIKKRFLGTFGYSPDHDIEENMQHKFNYEKKINLIDNYTKNELCKKYDWDVNMPIVVIFSIDLTDGIYTNSWRLFKDNLTWIKETLNIIKEINHINWLVKSHPNDVKNKVITSTEKEVLKLSKNFKNINLFPIDFGNNSLPEIISTAVTADGSVGYEYPSMGIPSITCSESLYSNRGFNHEASSIEEYKNLLKNADKLKPLSEEQINKAKTFVYIYSVLAKVYSPLVPIEKINGNTDDTFWKNLDILLTNYTPENDDFYKNLKLQIEKSDRHTINYNYLK